MEQTRSEGRNDTGMDCSLLVRRLKGHVEALRAAGRGDHADMIEQTLAMLQRG